MRGYLHQIHALQDFDVPLSMNRVELGLKTEGCDTHWHENLEMIYVECGMGNVMIDTDIVEAHTGNVVVVNSNILHSVTAASENFIFDCIMIDKSFCDQNGIDLDKIDFVTVIDNMDVAANIRLIKRELDQQAPLYQAAARVGLLNIMVTLCREYVVERSQEGDNHQSKMHIVKPALNYLRQHFVEPIALDQMCRHMGVSKGYLCHTFKESTGKTVFEYVNFLRCHYAKSLLTSGNYNVIESMECSGFHNPSYFSQAYKRYIGNSPSHDLKFAHKYKTNG